MSFEADKCVLFGFLRSGTLPNKNKTGHFKLTGCQSASAATTVVSNNMIIWNIIRIVAFSSPLSVVCLFSQSYFSVCWAACRATWTAVWCGSGIWAWWWESAWALAWISTGPSSNLRYSQCVNWKIWCRQLWQLIAIMRPVPEFVWCCVVVRSGRGNSRAAFSDDSRHWWWTRGWAYKRVRVFTSL